jgi:gas vesicle protein
VAKCKYFVAGAFIGAVVGAAVAVLTTPRNGKEMRDELEKNLEITKEKGKEFYYSLVNDAVEPGYKDQEKEDSHKGWMELPAPKKQGETKEKPENQTQEISEAASS